MKPTVETTTYRGLDAWQLTGPDGSRAVVSALGGQLLSWQTADGREHLFLSERAVVDGSLPIRGGVPVCFPQFAGLGDLPKHGFLRTRIWQLESQRSGDDFALLTLRVTDDEASRALWPHAFTVELSVMLEAGRLEIELSVDNSGETPFAFTGALHTYLRTQEVEDVSLKGLYGLDYRDTAAGDVHRRETGTELTVDREIDRIYFALPRPLHLEAGSLSLGIQQTHFPDVVVWNPWVERCVAFADMPEGGWRHMLCVEAAVVGQPVDLAPGENWHGRQTLVCL